MKYMLPSEKGVTLAQMLGNPRMYMLKLQERME